MPGGMLEYQTYLCNYCNPICWDMVTFKDNREAGGEACDV